MEVNTSDNDVLDNIRQYAQKSRNQLHDAMDVEDEHSKAVETRLATTIEALQRRLEKRQAELDLLKAKVSSPVPTAPSADPRERLKQLRAIKNAYERMTPEAPDLPDPRSALQPLLAARVIQKTIRDEKANISSTQSHLMRAEQKLSREESQLADGRAIAEALEARVTSLQQTQRENLSKSSADKAKEVLRAKTKRRHAFERETQKLRNVLNEFIDEHLAAMLAAEEIGGPVVGELMDVDEDMLTAGFSAQGKPKSKPVPDSKRQRRIDEIWGAGNTEDHRHESEKDAAAEEVRALLGELFSAGGYVEMARDSAVARFLVRAKVAQFHPKDAKRLRLVDFARELDE